VMAESFDRLERRRETSLPLHESAPMLLGFDPSTRVSAHSLHKRIEPRSTSK
jgi:hypothetical protein